ncbi:MAG: D-alanine--D-alanine ligase [Paludibacteraceae bacterium]
MPNHNKNLESVSGRNREFPYIAIVAGGDSSEWEVSMRSASGIYSFMDKEKFNCYIVTIIGSEWNIRLSDTELVPIDKSDFSFSKGTEKISFDFAYITIHGTPGENGILQGYFELLKIPYSTCNVLVSALTFDKFTCNQYLKSYGIKAAEAILLRQGSSITDEDVLEKIGLPCFIKPNTGGSSFGTTKVKKANEIQPAIQSASEECSDVLIERYIKGNEFTCGIYKTRKNKVVLPVTEIISENEFFDYGAKYYKQSLEITPARISDELTGRIQDLTNVIYDILGCKGIIRVDYIISDTEEINLLEVNTTPGMTETSFIPQQVRAAGLNMTDVMTELIENELNK